MKVYVSIIDAVVYVQATVESEDEEILGDINREVWRGEDLWGKSYEDWVEMGEGEHTIPD